MSRHPDQQNATGTLVVGARVLAPEPLPAGADAVAVLGEQVVAVGPADVVASSLPPGHAVVDLTGRTVVPGFIDAHLHPLPMAYFEHHLDLVGCVALADALDLVADRARGAGPDEAVVALRLDDDQLAERRLPTRAELDRAGGGRTVVVLRRDGHHAIGSTAALEAAGFGPGCADPAGGYLERAADGSLTGLCGEAASSLLLSTVPVPDFEHLDAAFRRCAARLVRQGVTGISAICQTGDEGPAGAAGALEAVAWSAMVEHLPFDIQTILVSRAPAELDALRDSPLHDPGAARRLDAVKLFLDGTLGGHSACMQLPYADRPGATGMLTVGEDDAYERVVAAHTAGLSVCVHAIGDRATRLAAELFDRVLTEHPGPHRHRVEHASVLDDATVALLADRGVSAVVQPISLSSERVWLRRRLGHGRLGRTYPFRTMLDAGITVASSSDAPVEDSDVLAGMRAAVDRGDLAPEQAVTPSEALAMATTGAARVRGTEGSTGAVAAGRRADLVVLSGDPRSGLDGIEVLATMVAGRVEHGAELFAGVRTGADAGAAS